MKKLQIEKQSELFYNNYNLILNIHKKLNYNLI